MKREAKVESELYRLLKNVLEKRGYTVEGVRFDGVEPQYRVDNRRADLALVLVEKKPLLIIETKRKIERRGYYREERKIDPTGRVVIDQALWYAIHCGSPLFATTNGKTFALFTVPERGERFSYEKHRILIKEITLNELFAEELLLTIAKLHVKAPVSITPLDWAFIVRLRSFVNWFADVVAPLIKMKTKADEEFRKRYERFAEEVGYKPDAEQLAKEMSYVLMNKIVFYKVLERHYKQLSARKLKPISAPDSKTYLNILYSFFNKAVEVTKDFEPVFYARIYDEIEIPDSEFVFDEINAFIEDMEHHKLEDLGSDIVGFIYEELIPASERHALGQFYTPPAIAELITKWAIRSPEDKVLDPGCGSGTFLVKAYSRLLKLKGYKEPTEKVHKEILTQLYGFDINPFPLHLTALNLASRYIRAPSTEVNTILSDFFRMEPVQKFIVPYTVKTPAGEIKREVSIPKFDAIVANPPYTRWTEIPEKTREAIKDSVGKSLTDYGLTAQVTRGVESGIYIHFIMHGFNMLDKAGRLGMIISDSWLQTDYGVDFGRFLLDHFKVKALIDISARVFPVPLIGTCIVLLEKCVDEKERENNQAVFIYADLAEGETFEVDEVLEAIENPEKYEERYLIRSVRQGSIAKDQKWINILFDPDAILNKLRKKTAKMGKLFDPSYGNAMYLYLASRGKTSGPRNLGTKAFFYLDEDKLKRYGLKDCAHAALTSARYAKWFTFTKEDWEKRRKKGSSCYLFMCHEPRDELPENVLDYIKWGETKCRTLIRATRGGGKICSQALACQAREKAKEHFYGWYDLGGVKKAPIMAIYQSQYKTRFILTKYPFVTYHAILTFIPNTKLTEEQLKALLAYLNSSFTQLYIESHARITGMGVAALEVKHADKMPILNVEKLKQKDLELLASLFDKLETEARKIGGANTSENIEKLWDTIIEKIDVEITRILKLPKELAKSAKIIAKSMMKRRLQRAGKAAPEAIKGEEAPRIRPPEKVQKRVKEDTSIPLDRFFTND